MPASRPQPRVVISYSEEYHPLLRHIAIVNFIGGIVLILLGVLLVFTSGLRLDFLAVGFMLSGGGYHVLRATNYFRRWKHGASLITKIVAVYTMCFWIFWIPSLIFYPILRPYLDRLGE